MTHALAHELKQAGFPQPEPKAGQMWYKTIFEGSTSEHIALCICLEYHSQIVMQAVAPRWDYPGNSGFDKKAIFAPTLDDIAPYLPPTFALEMWDGKPSCTNLDDENPLRTFGDTFAEAAGRMWLETKKKGL